MPTDQQATVPRGTSPGRKLAFGPYLYDPDTQFLHENGRPVVAPPRALAVLGCLLKRPGQVLSKDVLLDEVWGGVVVSDASLSEAVRVLRQALGDDPKQPTYIETVPKRGYRFAAPVLVTDGSGFGVNAGWFPPSWRVVGGVAALIGVGFATGVFFSRFDDRVIQPPPVAGLQVSLAENAQFVVREFPGMALSPDGRFLAYAGPGLDDLDRSRGYSSLFLRVMETGETRAIAESRNGVFPVFSPDGQWLTFWRRDFDTPEGATGPVIRVAVSSGSAETLVPSVNRFTGGAWTADGAFVFGAGDNNDLWRLEPGGNPKRIARGEPEHLFFYPQELPGSGDFLVTLRNPNAELSMTSIGIVDRQSGRTRTVIKDGLQATYVASGHLIYVRGSDLLAVPFDPQTGVVTEGSLSLVVGMEGLPGISAQFAVARQIGTLMYALADETRFGNTLELWRRDGEPPEMLPATPALYQSVAFSPSGNELVLTLGTDAMTIWRYPLDGRRSLTKVLSGGWNRNALWTADGESIIFNSSPQGTYDIFRMPVDGSAPHEPLVVDEGQNVFPTSVSRDGAYLAYTRVDPDNGMDIWLAPLEGDRRPQPFLVTPFHEYGASFSPDARWLAYASNESGGFEVYVRPVPTDLDRHDPGSAGERHVLSTDCGDAPIWSPAGDEVFFRSCAGQGDSVWAVAIRTEPELSYDRPVRLFNGSRDDSTFFARRGGSPGPSTPMGNASR